MPDVLIYIMLKIGITGGIGSGKTTVCKVWESLGAYIINADVIAKKLMVHDESVKNKLIDVFGSEAYYPDGSLNRIFLANEAFGNNRVDKLNNIIHPAVFEETDRLLQIVDQEGYQVAVYEAAILFQNGRPERMDYIVLVIADEEKRINRVRERDNVDKNKVENRIKSQQNFENFENKADIVIRNNASLKMLEKEAEMLYQRLLKRSS